MTTARYRDKFRKGAVKNKRKNSSHKDKYYHLQQRLQEKDTMHRKKG